MHSILTNGRGKGGGQHYIRTYATWWQRKKKIKEVIWLNKVQEYPNFGNMTLENLNPAGDFYALLSSICQLPVL